MGGSLREDLLDEEARRGVQPVAEDALTPGDAAWHLSPGGSGAARWAI
jgi:hypothetical protein